jgi:hypothetical protein
MRAVKLAALAGSAAIALGLGLGACSSSPATTAQAKTTVNAIVAKSHIKTDLSAMELAAKDADFTLAQKDARKVQHDSAFIRAQVVAVSWGPAVQAKAVRLEAKMSQTGRCMGAVSDASGMFGLLAAEQGAACKSIDSTPAAKHHHAAAPATAAVPAPTAPAPVAQPAAPAAPVMTGNSQYVNDILAAGIVAPAGWITATGNTLCHDWNTDGVPVATTDQTVLEAGGILPGHVATFDAITAADVC